jgi:hypothetical protein
MLVRTVGRCGRVTTSEGEGEGVWIGHHGPGRLRGVLTQALALWSGFPRTMRAGIAVVWIGFLADTTAHLTAPAAGGGAFTVFEHLAHGIGIAGMVLTLVGIALQRPPVR